MSSRRPILSAAVSEALILCINALMYSTYALCLVTLLCAAAERFGFTTNLARQWRARLSSWRTSSTQAISSHEVATLSVGGALAFVLVLCAVAAASEDDIIDSVAIAVLVLVFVTIGATLLSLGALITFVASPVGSGAVWRKVVFDDTVNFALYVLRVFLC
jgi:hypothetical protein